MNKYISIKVILDNILEHPMLRDVSLERAVNHTVNFMRIIGCPNMFEEKTAVLNIEDYRAALPCDLYQIIQVRTCDNKDNYRVFRYSTDNFHMSENKQNSHELTYKTQGSVIFTSIKEGIIEMSYNAFVVDEDGFPMIPDNSSFISALEFYIKKKYFTILFDLGKINGQVLNQVNQDYAWAVGQAQSSLIKPTIDQMQSITNSLNTLIQRTNEHKSGFVNNGNKEFIKLQ